MTVQWTAHIPQAMQRHGASLKPCGDGRPAKVQPEAPRPAAEEKAER